MVAVSQQSVTPQVVSVEPQVLGQAQPQVLGQGQIPQQPQVINLGDESVLSGQAVMPVQLQVNTAGPQSQGNSQALPTQVSYFKIYIKIN